MFGLECSEGVKCAQLNGALLGCAVGLALGVFVGLRKAANERARRHSTKFWGGMEVGVVYAIVTVLCTAIVFAAFNGILHGHAAASASGASGMLSC